MAGKWFSFEIIRRVAKITGLGLLIFGVSALLGYNLSQHALPAAQAMAADGVLDQPDYNWFVCEDLGLGSIPGVPDPRQIFRLCHNQGWEIRAYCLQPNTPAPPLGTNCSNTSGNTYWCGDTFQLLEEFAQDVTPTSSPVPSATQTLIPTQTAAASQVATSTQSPTPSANLTDTPPPTITPRLTNSPTPTATATNTTVPGSSLTPITSATNTPVVSITPGSSPTASPAVSLTNTPAQASATSSPAATLTPSATHTFAVPAPIGTTRPRPGGSGNLPGLSLGAITLGLLAFALGFVSLMLFNKSWARLRLPSGSMNFSLPSGSKMNRIPARILAVIWLTLLVFSGYLIFIWIPQSLIGLPQPASIPESSLLNFRTGQTPTPFQPRHPTPEFSPQIAAAPLPSFAFQQVDFSPQAGWRKIIIDPASQQINQGKPIVLAFTPAETCNFGDQQACVSAHAMEKMSNLIFLTVHSGYGGEGQPIRHALEGTGINQAAFSLGQVQENLKALQRARVSLVAEGNESGGFEVRGIIRIPAAQLEVYFDLPIEEALKMAGSQNPDVWSALDPRLPVLIVETCGWKIPAEPGADAVSNTTGSVYVILIQPVR